MKLVLVTGEWLAQYEEKKRAEIVRAVYSLAHQYDWAVAASKGSV